MKTVKFLSAALSAAVCLFCTASSVSGWLKENGKTLLLGAAGLSAAGPDAGPSPSPPLFTVAEPSRDGPGEIPLLWEYDGVAVFHKDELPGVTATPQPGRAYAPVAELCLTGGAQVADFFVRDTTDSGTDLLYELNAESPVSLRRDGTPEILIYHTHTSEAYSDAYTGFYYTDMETRTGNRERSVVAVGEALKASLEAAGFGVVHDMTVNDEIYNGSYARSWEVIQSNLAQYPGIQVTIDVHRDSMTTDEGVKYKPTAVINGRKAAQAMLLAGCSADGSWDDFPNWEQNLRLILKVQQKAAELYPGLFRPMSFSNCKYNMNATFGSMLIEVGTEVNTVSEAEYTGRLIGNILAEVL